MSKAQKFTDSLDQGAGGETPSPVTCHLSPERKCAAFTLLEMLIVIGIIAILGGVMLAQFSGSTESALATSCLNNMRTLCNAVMAEGSKEGRYPAAGSYQYLEVGSKSKYWYQGWIGLANGDQKVSCYYTGNKAAEDQHYAITNGTIWRTIGGIESAYTCPSHVKFCKRAKHPTPAWSYVMNSYFGWDYGTSGDIEVGRRSYGGGFLTFKYTSSPPSRKRPIEKILLFAEIPYADNGIQRTSFSTGADDTNDSVLQYAADAGEIKKADKTASGAGEIIGFNHKTGKMYSAHVAFADGHCEKLMLPLGTDDGNLRDLTTWLCTGQDYTFNGTRYEKAAD